ncbi:protein turtle homolog B [Belonocnema kinseyi]|uniref:protein turtle homolog B n=1 Tax=Belonocnema kinseyi TaxID=2817044 RepID=UPI00143D0E7D|nr:protein turtle homolog B [Belonocnema kinseyi]
MLLMCSSTYYIVFRIDDIRNITWLRFEMQLTSPFVFLSSLLTLLTTTPCFAAGSDGTPEFQNNVPMRLVWAAEGDEIELPCDITPPMPGDSVSMILWFKDSDGIPLYSVDARKGDVRSAVHWAVTNELGQRTHFQVADGHRARLKVNNVKFNDQGVFRCRVDFVNSPTRNFRVNLTLVEQPSKPTIYDARGKEVKGVSGPFLEGYDLLLTCQVSGGRPKPTVSWWQDGKLLDGVMDTPKVDGSSSKFTVNQLFLGKVTRSLWGTKLECRAQSGQMGKPVVKEVPLDIYLKPAVVKIFLSEDQIFAGRELTARCETWGSSPAARIVWRLGGDEIGGSNTLTTQRSNSTVSKISLVLGKTHDGRELTCRAENPRFPGGVLEETRIVRVLYPPVAVAHLAAGYFLDTLREGDDLKLACDVQSNPPPTSIIWYQDIPPIGNDIGSCIRSWMGPIQVRSSIPEAPGDMRSIRYLFREDAPRCRKGYERLDITVLRGETVKLRCEVEADPDDGVRFSWTYNSTRGDILPIRNPRVISPNEGLMSILDYKLDTDSDFGTLACWAINSVGRQRTPCIFNVALPKPPQPPIDCSLHNETSALEVNCIPGSDGGLPQHFLLEVRSPLINNGLLQTRQILQTPQSDQASGGEVPPIYQERNPEPIFQLHDLVPGIDYTVSVYAENKQGRSEPILLENIRVVEPIGSKLGSDGIFLKDLKSVLPEASSENFILAMSLIGTSSLILVGIGVVIGLTVCRKRRMAPSREGPDDFTTPTYVAAQRVEPRVRYGTNTRRSQRTSLYIEENRNDPDLLQQIETEIQS